MRKSGTIVILGQITGRGSIGTACNVHVKAKCLRVLARCADSAPMGLSAMDGVIAVVLEQLRQRRCQRRVLKVAGRRHGVGLQTVVVPVGHF